MNLKEMKAFLATLHGEAKAINESGLTAETQVSFDAKLAEIDQVQANIVSLEKLEVMEEAKRILQSGGKVFVIDWEKGSGGPGPPDDLRASKEIMKSIATEIGFQFEKEIDAGSYHFGLVFRKP